MIAAGKFASLPRDMQMNHEFPLASSMDLLSSKPVLADELHSGTHQDISIHGTLPRKKKGTLLLGSCDVLNNMRMLPYTQTNQSPGPVIQGVIEEYPQKNRKSDSRPHRDQNTMDPALEYVKV
ncbi:breast cancer anti-estrogen resistance protein 3 homolog [Pantherophis guttatus]|uniref:Breast cancer anti-estrogen resistance protein 3 homolog n=1 Tax=Pantherophis guttatus TaxID=94885 RepID=A0ABM3YP19_PANGU|nr:breast cancer anti-estrogen resistance protein 3 homolog [Pantherophis guttatus]